jgi:hypothetical protein
MYKAEKTTCKKQVVFGADVIALRACAEHVYVFCKKTTALPWPLL